MKVYRLERVNDWKAGPFQVHNKDIDPLALFIGRQDAKQQSITPADAAMIVAKVFGGKNPFDMPTMGMEPDNVELKFELFKHRHGDYSQSTKAYVFGFQTMKQYRQWFNTRKIRQAVLDYDKDDPIELREFTIPDDKVFVAPHQVVFKIKDATENHVISKEKAVR